MPAQRLPWFRFWVGATANAKVRTLNDGVFRTWVELLDLAAQQPRRGRFASAKEAAALSRRSAQHVGALIHAGLIDTTPEGLVMHDWDDWQRWRKEDAIDPLNDTGTTHERPPDQPTIDPPNDHGNDQFSRVRASAPVRREERREIRELRDVVPGWPAGHPGTMRERAREGGLPAGVPAEVIHRLSKPPIELNGGVM